MDKDTEERCSKSFAFNTKIACLSWERLLEAGKIPWGIALPICHALTLFSRHLLLGLAGDRVLASLDLWSDLELPF